MANEAEEDFESLLDLSSSGETVETLLTAPNVTLSYANLRLFYLNCAFCPPPNESVT